MIGLKSGTVKLVQHQEEWHENAENVISVLKQLLGDTALDIQHVGSTAICSIHAKPIIDIAVAVHDIKDILPYIEVLKQHNIFFHEGAVAKEIFFVMEDGDICCFARKMRKVCTKNEKSMLQNCNIVL